MYIYSSAEVNLHHYEDAIHRFRQSPVHTSSSHLSHSLSLVHPVKRLRNNLHFQQHQPIMEMMSKDALSVLADGMQALEELDCSAD
jgi:hypothetical protein